MRRVTPSRGGIVRRLPAGVIDAALASLATFATGLAAVNLLGDVERGVYAVFFTAFGLGTVLPNQLGYGPTEIISVEMRQGERLTVLRRSIRVGLPMSAFASISVVPAILVTGSVATAPLILPLAVTCAATILLSPTQDHVRRMLHIDGSSWAAAGVSAVQLAAAVVAIGSFALAGVPATWIPFGSLAIANLFSLLAGAFLITGRIRQRPDLRIIRLSELWDLGSWLFVGSLVPSLTAFGVAAVITVLAGAEALGYAEAARIVAQPVLVLGTGLTAVLAPRTMEAALHRAKADADRLLRGYTALVGGSAAVYALVIASAWGVNPMARLVPAAYVEPGLVAATIGVNVLLATAFLFGHELAAARRQRALAFVAIATAPLRLLTAATAGVTGAFARPLAQGAGIGANLVAYQVLRRDHYRVEVTEARS